ncbi:MAG TPA: outer membrane beta-barrel protein [Povalibacter sp.]|nr:outer membrane beta-barrel protein [Povalibacter sp.]
MAQKISRMIPFAAGCLALGCLTAANAVAAEPGFYVGVNYSQVDNSVARAPYDALTADIYDSFGFVPTSSSATFDAKDKGYGFFGGYRFFSWLALEGSYLTLGSVEHRDRSAGTFAEVAQTWSQNIETRNRGLAVSALGILPISYRFEVYARAGALFANNQDRLFITDGTSSRRASGSGSSVNMLAGAGASFAFLEIYSARLEYQRAFDVGSDLGKGDIDVLSLGISVRF